LLEMAQDINKLIEEADANCQEMIRLLKECVEILDRMEKMVDEAVDEVLGKQKKENK
tara:strand:+ start:1047 stop:1217 length:171 start_codon:yes stop_codon:yes gene_type:complete